MSRFPAGNSHDNTSIIAFLLPQTSATVFKQRKYCGFFFSSPPQAFSIIRPSLILCVIDYKASWGAVETNQPTLAPPDPLTSTTRTRNKKLYNKDFSPLSEKSAHWDTEEIKQSPSILLIFLLNVSNTFKKPVSKAMWPTSIYVKPLALLYSAKKPLRCPKCQCPRTLQARLKGSHPLCHLVPQENLCSPHWGRTRGSQLCTYWFGYIVVWELKKLK